jgi:hypothetical protein
MTVDKVPNCGKNTGGLDPGGGLPTAERRGKVEEDAFALMAPASRCRHRRRLLAPQMGQGRHRDFRITADEQKGHPANPPSALSA